MLWGVEVCINFAVAFRVSSRLYILGAREDVICEILREEDVIYSFIFYIILLLLYLLIYSYIYIYIYISFEILLVLYILLLNKFIKS